MQITLKLHAMLAEYLPPGAARHVGQVQLADGADLDVLIERLQLPKELVHLVLVNGVQTPPAGRGSIPLKDADTVAIWPPVAGG